MDYAEGCIVGYWLFFGDGIVLVSANNIVGLELHGLIKGLMPYQLALLGH